MHNFIIGLGLFFSLTAETLARVCSSTIISCDQFSHYDGVPDPDITSRLKRILNIGSIYLQGAPLERDFGIFLDVQLFSINPWSEEMKNMVKTTLVSGADGMQVDLLNASVSI